MMSSYISTLSWTSGGLNAMNRIQQDITKANTEIATGRYADIGETLGVRTSLSVQLRYEQNSLSGLVDGNSMTDALMTRSQTAIDGMLDTSNSFLTNLLSGQASAGTSAQLQLEAQSAMSAFSSALNTTDGTRYVFGGVNSAVAPMTDYDSGPGAAVTAAFTAKFGFAPGDSAAANISGTDMQDFLDNEFADVFSDANWKSTWSTASDEAITKQISPTERATVSATANDQAIRKLTMAFTMMGQLGIGSLNTEALQAVMDTARTDVTQGITGLTAMGSAIGVAQTRVTAATTQMKNTLDVVDTRISTLEGVDPAEAKTRLDTLTNQLSMTYSTTSKLMSLSILNFV